MKIKTAFLTLTSLAFLASCKTDSGFVNTANHGDMIPTSNTGHLIK